jgi:hypothetical protein
MDAHAPDRPGQRVKFYAPHVRLLAEHPQARYLKRVLDSAVEAAELDEHGRYEPPIELNLPANAQFQDRPGACKLI